MLPSSASWVLPVAASPSEADAVNDDGEDVGLKLLTRVPQLEPHFDVVGRIGSGTFSEVYLARLKSPGGRGRRLATGGSRGTAGGGGTGEYAIKLVVPTSHPNRLITELRCLLELGGKNNVIACLFSVRHEDHVAIVMPYFPHNKFKELVQNATVSNVRDYMKNLFIALQHVHAAGIIHRDVKPTNFLFNMRTQKYALVDFGLAQRIERKEPAIYSTSTTLYSDKRQAMESSSRDSPKKRRVLADLVAVHNASWSASGRQTAPASATPESKLRHQTAAATPESKALLERLSKDMFSCSPDAAVTFVPRTTTAQRPSAASLYDQPSAVPQHCDCFGLPLLCDVCTRRTMQQQAPRAGTAGFRPPEVLMRYNRQGTAVDMWAAGVMLLSLLSGRYPFFKGSEDMAALAQIAALLGAERLEACAEVLGKRLTFRPRATAPSSLAQLCGYLRSCSSPPGCSTIAGPCKRRRNDEPNGVNCVLRVQATPAAEQHPQWPDLAIDLLERLLEPEPDRRISAADALSHRFFHP